MFRASCSKQPGLLVIILLSASALLWAGAPTADSNFNGVGDHIATFSIVGRDPENGDLGVAVQSKYFSVGSVVPHARAGVGVIATQARGNLLFGREGLDLLEKGQEPTHVMEQLLDDDPQRDERQVGIIDAQGRTTSYTGSKTLAWSGGRTGTNYAVQGNLLAGPGVVDAMAVAFETAQGDLATRLVMALAAGQAAGGDRRGRQSASVLVVRAGAGYMGASDRLVDLQVEDHPAPIRELRRLLNIRLAELAVKESSEALDLARKLPEGSEQEQAAGLAKIRAEEAVALDDKSYSGWLALAEARLWSGDQAGAAYAGQRALVRNPTLKRYADQPETGLGPDPALLEQLLTIDAFRHLWDAMPGGEAQQ